MYLNKLVKLLKQKKQSNPYCVKIDSRAFSLCYVTKMDLVLTSRKGPILQDVTLVDMMELFSLLVSLKNLELQLPQFMITMCCKLVCGSLDGVRLHEVDSLLSYDGWCGG